MCERQKPTHKAKTQKKPPAKKNLSKYQNQQQNQNQNRQIQQRKLIQHVIQHETVHISQRENPTKKTNSTDKLAINDERQQHTKTIIEQQ